MPTTIQRTVRAVGDDSETPVNVRIISATHKDLGAMVASGAFRQDLYYRLNVIEMRTAPLREHAEDIPLLVQSILGRLGTHTLEPAALQHFATIISFVSNSRDVPRLVV